MTKIYGTIIQPDLLDKMRNEIEQCREQEDPHLCDYRKFRNEGLDMALEIIDKYIKNGMNYNEEIIVSDIPFTAGFDEPVENLLVRVTDENTIIFKEEKQCLQSTEFM